MATRCGFRDAVWQWHLDLYQSYLGICGGFTEGQGIKAMVLAENARLAPHCWCGAVGQAATPQMLATVPAVPFGKPELGDAAGLSVADAACFEFDVGFNPLAAEATATPFHAVESMVAMPDGPGLRITPDEDWLDAHLLEGSKLHVGA